jgi:histidinol-phosphate aminotransferase
MADIEQLLRENVRKLIPYSSARDEYKKAGKDRTVMLDANESPYDNGLNRYPDPYQQEVKKKVGQLKNIHPQNIFLGNGSDEAIDLLIRAFCIPGKDRILITPPTYGMYKVSADINDIEQIEVDLDGDFQLDVHQVFDEMERAKMIFLCSPVNPTGNLLNRMDIISILKKFEGIMVVDEAYIDFCPEKSSLLSEIEQYPNLVVLQTLSKAWGMAGLRLGMAFAQEKIISVVNRIKPPYNINILTQQKVLEVLEREDQKKDRVDQILMEKDSLVIKLSGLSFVQKIHPSDGNFVLVKFEDSAAIFNYLKEHHVIIRDRSGLPGCEDCLRITIGLPDENRALIEQLKNWRNG